MKARCANESKSTSSAKIASSNQCRLVRCSLNLDAVDSSSLQCAGVTRPSKTTIVVEDAFGHAEYLESNRRFLAGDVDPDESFSA